MIDISVDVDMSEKEVSLKADTTHEVPIYDYDRLKNKPTLNGATIQGDMYETDPTVPTWAKNPEKPQYTPEELNALDQNNVITLEEIDEIFKGL